MADCVVIVPMLGRAHMVEPLAASLAASTDRARLLFVVSRGDVSVLDEVDGSHDFLLVPRWERGDYGRKINAGIKASAEPLIFTGAIDLDFRSGWLDAAEALMSDTVGVVGTVDRCNPRTESGLHSTHSLVARWYADLGQIDGQPGLLHEDYWHEYVDDEMVAVARHRKAYAHAYGSVVEHLHWLNGKREADAMDGEHQLRMLTGRKLFNFRRHLWT